MKKCIGKPVPAWDMAHRLPIDRPVGPKIQDFGSTFRVNSTFMDAVEPSFLEKQWYITGGTLAFVCVGIGPYVYWLTQIRYPDAGGIFGNFLRFAFPLSLLILHSKSSDAFSSVCVIYRCVFTVRKKRFIRSVSAGISPVQAMATSYGRRLGQGVQYSACIARTRRLAPCFISATTPLTTTVTWFGRFRSVESGRAKRKLRWHWRNGTIGART